MCVEYVMDCGGFGGIVGWCVGIVCVDVIDVFR